MFSLPAPATRQINRNWTARRAKRRKEKINLLHANNTKTEVNDDGVSMLKLRFCGRIFLFSDHPISPRHGSPFNERAPNASLHVSERNKGNFGGSFEIFCNFGGSVVILVGPKEKCCNSSGSERNRCNFGGSRE